MKTKGLWLWIERKITDVVKIVLFVSNWDGFVETTGRECKVVLENLWLHVDLQDVADKMFILSFCDSTSIVDVSSNIVKDLEWNFIICLNKDLKLSSAHK